MIAARLPSASWKNSQPIGEAAGKAWEKAAMAQQDRINNRFSKALLARHRPR